MITADQFNEIVGEAVASGRLHMLPSLIAQVMEVARFAREQQPDGELIIYMEPFEYMRLETRSGSWGQSIGLGFELVGKPNTEDTEWYRLIRADHVRHAESNANFYPEFEKEPKVVPNTQ